MDISYFLTHYSFKTFFKILLTICFLGNFSIFAVPIPINSIEKKPKKAYQVSKNKKTKTKNGIIISKANIAQYRYYNDVKKNLTLLQEAHIKPIENISTQVLWKIFNEAENVNKIVIKFAKDLSIESFTWPKVKRVQQSIFETSKETIFCTWEILDENETSTPIKALYAINAKIINNISVQYIYAPFVKTIDPNLFNNPTLKKIFVGPDFEIANVPKKKRPFLKKYSMEEQASIHLLHLSLIRNFNDIIEYTNHIKCPPQIDKKRWNFFQETVDNTKLIMEKKIDPFSLFYP